MLVVAVADFDAWRTSARKLLSAGTPPEDVLWQPASAPQGVLPFGNAAAPRAGAAGGRSASVPKAFVELAETAACHRSEGRWALLYRVLWRLQHGERHLLEIAVDDDVALLRRMVQAVKHDVHRMYGFVRFRRCEDEFGPHYIAWHRPDHLVLSRAAGFFCKRFGAMRWAILTPDESCYWDAKQLRFGPGVPRSAAPAGDELEPLWRQYYAATFNPARLNARLLVRELPRRFWPSLPEAAEIPSLLIGAKAPTDECPTAMPSARGSTTSAADFLPTERDLKSLQRAAARCRGCPLFGLATGTVFGEGPARARAVFVGEQPGDEEDIAGRPFVGPAGRLLDDALRQVGIDRQSVYVTNAVKHFKYTLRGKRRIHAKPDAREQAACRPWLEAELAAVRPEVLVCLGATAVRAILGPSFRLTQQRGMFVASPACEATLATYHPSALLRAPDEARRKEMRAAFMADLKRVAERLRQP